MYGLLLRLRVWFLALWYYRRIPSDIPEWSEGEHPWEPVQTGSHKPTDRRGLRRILRAQRDKRVPDLSFGEAFHEEIWDGVPQSGWVMNNPPMDRTDPNYMPTVVSRLRTGMTPEDIAANRARYDALYRDPEKIAEAKKRPLNGEVVGVVCEDPEVTKKLFPGMELDVSDA